LVLFDRVEKELVRTYVVVYGPKKYRLEFRCGLKVAVGYARA
jgi:hypothetical protein